MNVKYVSEFIRKFKKMYRELRIKNPEDVLLAYQKQGHTQIAGALQHVPHDYSNANPEHVFNTAVFFTNYLYRLQNDSDKGIQILCALEKEDPLRVDDLIGCGLSAFSIPCFILASSNISDLCRTKNFIIKASTFKYKKGNPYAKIENYRITGGFYYSDNNFNMRLPMQGLLLKYNKSLQTPEYREIRFDTPSKFARYFF